MMKTFKRYIIWMMAWIVTMPMWAQEPQPEPVITTVVDTVLKSDFRPTEYHQECSNHLPYMWRDKDLRATDVYYDTVETRSYKPAPVPTVVVQDTTLHDTLNILHTIYSMDFTVNPTIFIERKIELRKGGKVEVRGRWYTEPGTYYDTIPSSTTCDSILHITIVWAEHYRQFESQEICYGNSIVWHGKTLSEEGIYWDSLTTTQGYDSVFQLYLYVHYRFVHHDSISVCETDTSTLFWRGMHIAEPGTYKRTYIDQYGCDSTYYMHLTVPQVSPTTVYTEYFCRNQGYVWRNKYYYVQKTFTDSLINVAGCDSLVAHTFIPRDNDFHTETIQHYKGVPVPWRDSVYVIDSIYQDTLINRFGCDSIIELRLVPKYDLDRNVVRCKGDTAMFHKEIITENCDRHDTLKAVMGGDSIYHMHYSFKSSFYSREYITICSNEYFEWTGHKDKYTGELIVLHEEGQYYDRHRNEAGCDSTYEIIVKHSPAWIKDSVVLICKDTNEIISPVIWFDSKGKKYEFYPHTYLDTIIRDTMRHTDPVDPHFPVSTEGFAPVTGGCDSIFNFHLIITDRCSDLDSIPMCTDAKGQNIPVVVDGRSYTEPGLYSNKMPSSMHQELLMKDSTHTFVIWIAPKDTSYDTVRWCESRLPVVYHNGQKFYNNQSGDYQLHFFNRWGCDSLVYLHLDIIPTVYSPIQVYNQFCPGDTIHVETPTGKVFTHAGEYTDTVPYGVAYNWEGCDSIIRYKIAYKPSFHHTETHYLSLDRNSNQWTFRWLNHLGKDTVFFHTDGIYYDSCTNVFGCDSVYQLHLMYPAAFFKSEEEHLCANQLPYIWRGKTINQPGYYYDSLYTAYKLDSIYQLKVTIDSVYRDTIIKHFCRGDYFNLRGKLITTSGNYNDTLRTQYACDSIFTYVVSFITASVAIPEEKHIAEGTSINWYGHILNQTGTYYDTIRATPILDGGHACDSVIRSVKLVVEKPFYKAETAHICDGNTLIWHKRSISESGVYWDSCKTIYGLDSVYQLSAFVHPTYSDTIYHHMCQGDAFSIQGKSFTSSGIYRDTLTSASGCDSIICHIVSFATSATHDQQTLRCNEGQSVLWHGKEYFREGIYLDTLRNQWGCDSICYSMHLIINRSFYQFDSVTLCTNEFPYRWHNHDYYSAGTYWDSCHTAYQLDSVYQLRIDTLPSYFYSYTQFICPGSSYNFGGQVLTEPGRYINHLYQQNGCDSIIRCVLNFAPQYFYDEKMTYVEGGEWPVWHGKVLDHEGYYFDSLQTKEFGCDSIHRVYLKKSQSYSFYEEKELCENLLPYAWQGKNLTEAGLHTAAYTTQDGRDSIYQINLVVHPVEITVLNEYICPDNNYKLFGKTYTQPGIYRDTMYTEEGCYSITELHLNYYNTVTSEVHHQLCPGDSIIINGQMIKQSGTYEETTKSHITGCDSIIRHIVGFHTAFFKDESKTINPGEVYIWHKDGIDWPLSESGTYFDSCKNVFGCDSIYRLQLTINQVEYHFPVEEVTVCEGSLPYVWHKQSFYNDTTVIASYKTRLGRDSIYTLHLQVSRANDVVEYLNFCEGNSHEINGTTYTRSTQFTDTITNKYGCDSLRIHYVINFYPRYSITQLIELKNSECYHFGAGTPQDTLICTSGTYYRHFTTIHGCDSLVTLKVTTCSTNKDTTIYKDLCGNETFTFNGQVVSESGKYINYLKTTSGCDSVVTYIVNIHHVSDEYRAVSICQGDSYTWTGHFHDTVLTKPGIYVDSVRTPSGCYNTSTLKLSYKSQAWSDTLISMCADKLPYTYKGKKYFVDTVFYDTVGTNIHGCDSILRWHYEINRHCSPYDQYIRCSNEIKYIEGLLIDKAGVYSVNRLTRQGEDSIYRFIVTDAQPYEQFTTLAPACDSITYQGATYLARGAGRESFQVDRHLRTIDGCDSIEHLLLTIYQSSPKYIETATIADFQSYSFEGRIFNTPGTHTIRYLNQHNCDSIRELQLHVQTTTYHIPDTFAFCSGEHTAIKIFGKLYYPTRDTIIYDTVWVSGQPHIYTALVNQHHPFVIKNFNPVEEAELCSDYIVPFHVEYTIAEHSAMPEYYDYYFVEQDLEVKHDTVSSYVGGKTVLPLTLDGRGNFVQPGYYTYRIHFRSPSCSYADTAFTGQILVRYPKNIMQANWDNVITLVNEEYNDGYWTLIPPYAWQVYNSVGGDKTAQVVSSNHAQPYIASDHLADGDRVIALLYREGYAKPVPSCSFTFTTQAFNPAVSPIVVYPTATAKSSTVHVQARQSGDYQLYSPTGDKCSTGTVEDGDNTVTMPASAGCYLMHVTLQDGSSELKRVMVY